MNTTSGSELNRQTSSLPNEIAVNVAASLEEWRLHGNVRKLWARDAALWTGQDEAQWLGWLGIMDDQLAHLGHLNALAEEVKREGFSHALLLGMGGSSLCPEVLALTFGQQAGFPRMHVLDSTDPAQVTACEQGLDLANTLFIVSSKSGGTLEPNIFKQYFFDRVQHVVGPDKAGSRFIAITDPGSKMQQVAERDHFRHIFFGVPTIGGRYSALSHFGMVPAAVMGIDVARFLDQAEEMRHSCDASVPPEDNPGVVLGTVMGIAARHGRDKVTIIASPGLSDLGAWLEQLIAESTGKLGKGVIPVDGERPAESSRYGDDRLFAYVRLESAPDATQDDMVDALEHAGQPVVRILVPEPYTLGQELFRWEMATAVAGSILGINPFDQPDVEASKIATKTLTSEYERTGSLPPETPVVEEQGITLFTDAENAKALADAAGADRSILSYLRAHLGRLKTGDYFALLAYIEMNDQTREHLQIVRHAVRDAKRVATCLGFGPRFLHSTGQAYKGGPNTGVFLQITCADRVDVPVPGQRYTFGLVKAAQARGDFDVLAERKRRALRVHLGPDLAEGLRTLQSLIEQAVE